jgi:hypothetical protein
VVDVRWSMCFGADRYIVWENNAGHFCTLVDHNFRGTVLLKYVLCKTDNSFLDDSLDSLGAIEQARRLFGELRRCRNSFEKFANDCDGVESTMRETAADLPIRLLPAVAESAIVAGEVT